MEKFRNKYRVNSTRLEGYDYGKGGAYFITICVKDNLHCFGKVIEKDNFCSVELTELGSIAEENFKKIAQLHPYALTDQFIVMPNHIHGIIAILDEQNAYDLNNVSPLSAYKNTFGPQRKNIPSIIRGYKSSVKSYALKNNILFEWQSGYYDRVIRDHTELEKIQQYISENPLKWTFKKDNTQDLFI